MVNLTVQLKPEQISRIIRSQIKYYQNTIEQSETGTVTMVGDGIARAAGLDNCMAGELVQFESGAYGMAQNLEENSVSIVLLGDDSGIKEGSSIHRTGKVVSVPVGEGMIGRVVNALGQPIDGKGPIEASDYRAHRIPGSRHHGPPACQCNRCRPASRPSTPMIPIGRGQRELIIGDRQTGKTAIATRYHHQPEGQGRHLCIYVAIGQKRSTVASARGKTLEKNGAMAYTIVVCRHSFGAGSAAVYRSLRRLRYGRVLHAARASMSSSSMMTCPSTRSLTVPCRCCSAVRRDVKLTPAMSSTCTAVCWSVPPSLSDEKGGGSLTALPIIETQAGDVSAYIPTNVISITDGQIFLETELFHAGIRPAVNPGISVSRVGGNAQIKAMKKVAGTLKLIYSQYRELQGFRPVRL